MRAAGWMFAGVDVVHDCQKKTRVPATSTADLLVHVGAFAAAAAAATSCQLERALTKNGACSRARSSVQWDLSVGLVENITK